MWKTIMLFAALFAQTNNANADLTRSRVTVQEAQIVPGIIRAAVKYDESAQNRLLEKVQNRKPLSESDKTAKAKILQLLPKGSKSGILYTSPNFHIEYVSDPNVFQVEITKTDINLAKKEAEEWFRKHGFSQDAICNYPIEFYLNWEIKNALRNKSTIFSPLGLGC
jgi:hypothetical protein